MCYEQSDFYCLNCGQRGLPLLRPESKKREVGHRKKLYCPHCKLTVNHIECHNEEEVINFKEAFNFGDFEEEAIVSIRECNK